MDKWNRKIIVAVTLIASFLFFGTLFFHYTEGWSYVDAFYFSGVTLTTVGYGEFVPTHAFSKIITVFFAFAGIGIVFYSIGIIAQKYFEREEERLQKIWEATSNVRKNAKSRLPEVELPAVKVSMGDKAAIINGAKANERKTIAILRRKDKV